MKTLRDLLQAIRVIDSNGSDDIAVAGLCYHSSRCTEGDLFVCITGYQTDGHRYLQDAVDRGAAAAIVERFQPHVPVPQFLVENSRVALARLGAAYYGHPADRMTMIGITATNGKTSTTYMVNAMLEKHGLTTGMIGTVVVKIDDETIPSELTTPESLDLQRYLRQMADRGVTHVSMEVSSAAQETNRVETVDYDIVAFNNLSREHIDSHGSFEQYFEAKSRLIRNAGEHAAAVLNLDDEYSASLIEQTNAQVVTFGVRRQDGYVACKGLDLTTGRAKFDFAVVRPIVYGTREIAPCSFRVELSVPGLHSVYNAMSAITIALLCGVPAETIQETMRSFQGVERRFEFIHEGDFTVVDDHFANPGNIHVTLETLKFMQFEKLHLVYAIRGSRGPTVNRENAEAIVEWMQRLELDELIATRSVSHVTAKDTVTDQETDVFLDVMRRANIKVRMYDELPEAVAAAIAEARRGDLILLAGCQGMDPGGAIAKEVLRAGGQA
jgi:UDP-N-acetylmuramyl-tripeptide synthetase